MVNGEYNKTVVRLYDRFNLEFMGGGEVFSIELLNFLSTQYKVECVSDSRSRQISRKIENEVKGLTNFNYIKEPFQTYSKFPFSRISQNLPSIDILSESECSLILIHRPVSRRFLRLSKQYNGTIIFLVHGLTFENLSQIFFHAPLLSIYYLYVKLLFKINRRFYASKNIYFQILNNSQLTFFRSLGVSANHIFKIENGINFSRYKVGRNDEKFIILFMGRIENQKGIDLLMKVVSSAEHAKLPICFVVLGSGKLAGKLDRFSKKYNNVEYRGYVAEEEKIKWLELSNLLVSTSYIEPFSTTIIEAFASGLPVVSTSASGPKSIISRETIFGHIVGLNASGLLKGIAEEYHRWSNDPEAYYCSKLRRREIARKEFSADLEHNSYTNMIDYVRGNRRLKNEW